MDICVLRMRLNKKKKDYHFESISDAALFENIFFSKKESAKVTHEILYKNATESKALLQELSRDPIKYANREFLNWFYPEEIPSLKKKSGAK